MKQIEPRLAPSLAPLRFRDVTSVSNNFGANGRELSSRRPLPFPPKPSVVIVNVSRADLNRLKLTIIYYLCIYCVEISEIIKTIIKKVEIIERDLKQATVTNKTATVHLPTMLCKRKSINIIIRY
jgi:hypothetical protein